MEDSNQGDRRGAATGGTAPGPDTASGPTTAPATPTGTPGDAPLTNLRGPAVEVDVRRFVGVLVAVGLLALAVLVVLLVLSGVHRNAQIARLHDDGVVVTVTVTGCQGELGGSGSNAAGDVCRGALTLGGRRYHETLPGDRFYRPGAMLRVVAVPSDPALLAPVRVVAGEHTSWRVFILPGVLLVVLVACGLILVRRRRRSPPYREP